MGLSRHLKHALACMATALAVPGAAFAEDLRVPQEYRTIEDALSVATDGSRIIVSGRHRDVHIGNCNVTLVGRGATLEGFIRVEGCNVTLRGFRIDGRSSVVTSVIVSGDDTRLLGNTVLGGGVQAISDIDVVAGAGVVVARNRLVDATVTLGRGSFRANVSENRFRRGAILAEGDQAFVRGNTGVTGGIAGIGLGLDIEANRLTGSGIEIHGDSAIVANNVVRRASFGVIVEGELAQVARNVLSVGTTDEECAANGERCVGILIRAAGPNANVEWNRITHTTGIGIDLAASGATLAANTVRGVGSPPSIRITGSGNTVIGNDVAQSGDTARGGHGFEIVGDRNFVYDNFAAGTAGDGVVVTAGEGNGVGSNVISRARGAGVRLKPAAVGTSVGDCRVTNCELGIVNSGTGTGLEDSVATDNRLADVLELVTFRSFLRNTVGTVSHDPALLE